MNKNIFETNDLSNLKLIRLNELDIYYMDNFYKYPDEVYSYITSELPPLWRSEDTDSYNNIYFEDRRHFIKNKNIKNTIESLSSVIGRKSAYEDTIITNFTRFKNDKFNDYKNCVWWPHVDGGPNAIIYLNKDIKEEHDGTSIYFRNSSTPMSDKEHVNPWQKKEDWEKIVDIKAYYNRLVIFDGNYYHAMNISDQRFFADSLNEAKFRINQVIFFD